MVIQPMDSADNKIIRQIRRLAQSHQTRKKSRETVVEGPHLIDEALAAGLTPRLVVYCPKWVERPDGRSFLVRLQALSVHLFYVTNRLFDELSQLETPQGILAVIPSPSPVALAHITASLTGPLLFPVALTVQDPGNLGTLIRAALACGAQAFGVASRTVEPINPKCIRASAGALFRLPVVQLDGDWLGLLKDSGASVRAAAAGQGTPYYELDWSGPTALLLGNEGNGLADELLARAEVVNIPMSPVSESLNVSMAGAILLFHAAYQRQAAGIGFLPPAMV